MFWSIVKGVLSIFGLASWLEGLEHDREERQQGRQQQHAADLEATVKVQDKMAQAAQDAPKTANELDDLLRGGKA